MKAISLWQPWASAMILNFKHNETRSWYTSYRGPLVIHAAKRADPWPNITVQGFFEGIAFQPTDLPRGCLLGVRLLIDCQKILMHNRPTGSERSFGDYTPYRFMWITEPMVVFKDPIPYRGKQGFFNVPTEIVDEAPRINIANKQLQATR